MRTLFSILFLAALTSPAVAEPAPKPNVLLICVDDLKPLLGCYGASVIQTPNIDKLAARGVLFQRAYCNQAVCAPSRNSLLTGRRSETLGIYDLGTNFRHAEPELETLPQHFRNAAYRTEAVGKIFHVGHGNHEDPVSWSVPHFQGKTVSYVLPENQGQLTREEALFSNYGGDIGKLPRGAAMEAADVDDSAYWDGKIADEAIRRLRQAQEKPEQPWFLAVGFLKPHLPFCAPKKYWDLYDPRAFAVPALRTPPSGAPAFAPTTWGELRQYSDVPATGPLSDEQARHFIHGYHAAVSYVDAQLGRVLDALAAAGQDRHTIIILWGDHGWHLGDHGLWSKHTNYEEAAHIPLIVAGAGRITAGTKTTALVETVDLYPTLCEVAGLTAPAGLDGKSFAATLRDPAAPTKDFIKHVFPRGKLLGRALRTERYRLVEWKEPSAAPETAVLELYDYEVDPAETKNLAAEQPAVVERLRALLQKSPEAKPQIHPPEREVLFRRRDKDGDGQLSRAEFMLEQPDPEPAEKRFYLFDQDGSGSLSHKEFVSKGGTEN